MANRGGEPHRRAFVQPDPILGQPQEFGAPRAVRQRLPHTMELGSELSTSVAIRRVTPQDCGERLASVLPPAVESQITEEELRRARRERGERLTAIHDPERSQEVDLQPAVRAVCVSESHRAVRRAESHVAKEDQKLQH